MDGLFLCVLRFIPICRDRRQDFETFYRLISDHIAITILPEKMETTKK